MSTDLRFVYITAPTIDIAKTLGRSLLEQRLAACINIIPQMNSMYWWEGKIESAEEVVLIAKTVQSKADALIAVVEALHPYNVACALTLAIEQGSKGYINWLESSL